MKRRLHDLPIDVPLLVLDELLGDSESLSHLSLAYKQLHHLVLPILLEVVDLSWHYYEDAVRPGWSHDNCYHPPEG